MDSTASDPNANTTTSDASTSASTSTSTSTPNADFDFASYLTLKNVFIVIAVALVLYFIISKTQPGDEEVNEEGTNTANVFMIILASAIVFAGYKLYQSYEITAEIEGEGTKNSELDININHLIPSSSSSSSSSSSASSAPAVPTITNEVFNIPGNYYTYESARAVCKAYEADLATYDQVEKAYNSGAEWCNYGWSEGQMALFPTQKASYDKLQTIKGHEHDCGRPGINGGYIANPKVRFGVNCYGKKPAINDYEAELMRTQSPYPETMKDVLFQKQVNYWKNKISDLLVSPFNYTTWSKV
jgi:hypothetical protein